MKTLYARSQSLLSDAHTPVGLFLKFRDLFAGGILMESSERHQKENNFSYLAFKPLVTYSIKNAVRKIATDESFSEQSLSNVSHDFEEFMGGLEIRDAGALERFCCFLGFTTHQALSYFEELEIKEDPDKLPDMLYSLHRYMLVFDHFKGKLHVISLAFSRSESERQLTSLLDHLEDSLPAPTPFETIGKRKSDQSDRSFLERIISSREHCFRGDVFQVVISRAFYQSFLGDDFNVYRHLRSINPSPYLFYFDYGAYRLMGSSPESQIRIQDGKARIYPIAGTFKRSGDRTLDEALIKELLNDPKESSEHIMLVDLARNDLSKHGTELKVERFRDIELYSHVIHMESEVSVSIAKKTNPFQIFTDTFPAGTLSGAPKYRALQLINQYEETGRGFYGGAIGWIRPNMEMNQAILIRSILSKNNTLTYRAGAGVVAASQPESELQEVYNKVEALDRAIRQAAEYKSQNSIA